MKQGYGRTRRWVFGLDAVRAVAGALLLATLAAPADATTYYVRKTGSNTKAGTSPSTAFKTIAKAATVASAGDVIYVGAGIYAGTIDPKNDGTASNPIRYVADTTGAFTGDAGTVLIYKNKKKGISVLNDDYIQFIGFAISGTDAVTWSGGTGGLLQDCLIYSATDDGVDVTSSTLTLSGCSIYSNTEDGVECKANATVTLTSCRVYSNGNHGLECSSSSAVLRANETRVTDNGSVGVDQQSATATLINCLITGNHGDGISVGSGSPVLVGWHCTVAGNTGDGIDQAAGTATVRNCIFANNTAYGLRRSGGTSTRSYNQVYGNTSGAFSGTSAATAELLTDPLFTSSTDYRLSAASPAKDSGTSGAAVTAVDLQSAARPAGTGWDRGCYEADGAVPVRHIVQWQEIEAN